MPGPVPSTPGYKSLPDSTFLGGWGRGGGRTVVSTGCVSIPPQLCGAAPQALVPAPSPCTLGLEGANPGKATGLQEMPPEPWGGGGMELSSLSLWLGAPREGGESPRRAGRPWQSLIGRTVAEKHLNPLCSWWVLQGSSPGPSPQVGADAWGWAPCGCQGAPCNSHQLHQPRFVQCFGFFLSVCWGFLPTHPHFVCLSVCCWGFAPSPPFKVCSPLLSQLW